MWLQEIRRYPVKSMAGESLEAAGLTGSGVEGDRILQVRSAAGRVMTARTRPLLLRHHAILDSDNRVLVDGRTWNAEDVARDVEAAAGAGARLVESDPEQRFDVLPLLIATDGMLAAVGLDLRDGRSARAAHHDRLRPGFRPARPSLWPWAKDSPTTNRSALP